MKPVELTKYPRTPHLPFSPGATSDDKWVSDDALERLASGMDLVVTEKMDGGNLTFTYRHFFARSLDSGTQPWDSAARALWSAVRFNIPEGWRISGESLYARRSVAYDNLPGPFLVFGVWDDTNALLSWDDTEEWAEMLSLPTVPVLYRGDSYEKAISAWGEHLNSCVSEGFVLRNSGAIDYSDFAFNVAKYVRQGHVTGSADWREGHITPNGIAQI